MNKPAPLTQSVQAWTDFWQARQPRERKQILLAAALAAAALIYSVGVAPALAGRARLEKDLPGLRQQAAQMQALAQEAAKFAATPAPPAAALSKDMIESALTRKGLKPQNVALSGDLLKVQVASASFAGLMDWLDEMQKSARLAVVDANITALAQTDIVNATLTLRQQRSD